MLRIGLAGLFKKSAEDAMLEIAVIAQGPNPGFVIRVRRC